MRLALFQRSTLESKALIRSPADARGTDLRETESGFSDIQFSYSRVPSQT